MAIFEENGEWNHDKFERAVVCMQDHSLIQILMAKWGGEIVVSLHSMVTEWLRMRIEADVLSVTLEMAASHLNIYLESAQLDYRKRQEVLLHMDNICRIAGNDIDKFCFPFGRFYMEHGRLNDAEVLYLRALAGFETALGAEHSSTLETVSNLGVLYARQGRLFDAKKMYEHALAGFEKALGAALIHPHHGRQHRQSLFSS